MTEHFWKLLSEGRITSRCTRQFTRCQNCHARKLPFYGNSASAKGLVTRIVLIRHGETLWNKENRSMGHLDSPLSQLGEMQAISIAHRLKSTSFSHLYSSDLGRAIQTAEYISRETGHKVRVEKMLRETNLGIFQGLTCSEKKEKYPMEWSVYNSSEQYEYIVPQGESQRQRTERSVSVMNQFAETHAGETIVAVSHAGILKGFLEHVIGITGNSRNRIIRKSATYNSFIKSSDKWALEVWGDTSHLKMTQALD